MRSRLIIALDLNSQKEALAIADQLDPKKCALKIGSEMFTLFGSSLINILVRRSFEIFLDLKFHDIPNTVGRSCKAAASLGVRMLTLHAAGGLNMMKTAYDAIQEFGSNKPLLMGVTVLTSMKETELSSIGVLSPIDSQVLRLAELAHVANMDGVICSAHEVAGIKQTFGKSFLTVTPGISLDGSPRNDQSRTMTPRDAILAGSDYLVIGRPITQAPNPALVIKKILNEF